MHIVTISVISSEVAIRSILLQQETGVDKRASFMDFSASRLFGQQESNSALH
jgi:preprotein translocase subunit SecG